jgi:hypothetical protein
MDAGEDGTILLSEFIRVIETFFNTVKPLNHFNTVNPRNDAER